MRKLLKVIMYVIILVVLLAVIGAILLMTIVDPNKLKTQVSAWVQEQTGRELVINGQIQRTFFPWLGLKVQDVTLSNPSGFIPKDNFFAIQEASVQIKLLPLLTGKLEVGKLDLKGFTLNLVKNEAGQTNWHDLVSKIQSETTKISASSSDKKKANLFSRLSVAGVDISHANVIRADHQKKQTLSLTDLNLKSQSILPGETFPVSLTFNMTGLPNSLSGYYAFDANVLLNTATQLYEFNRLKLLARSASSGLPEITLNADKLLLNLSQGSLDMANFILSSNPLNAKGSVHIDQLKDQPTYVGNLDIQTSDVRGFLKSINKEVSTRDPNVLQHLHVSTKFRGTDNTLSLDPLDIKLDGSSIKGTLKVSSFSPQNANFTLNLDQLNFDRYLPAPSMETTQVQGTTAIQPQQKANNEQTFAFFRDKSLTGVLKIGALTFSEMQLTQVQAQVAVQQGLIRIAPFTANVYGGMTQGELIVDVRSAIPHYAVNQSFTHVALQQVLKSDRLIGLGNLAMSLTSQGAEEKLILYNLNGNMQFTLENGAILGINIPYEVERALALVKKQPLPPRPEKNQTDFSKFTGTTAIVRGVLSNQDLLVQSPEFKMTGQGTVSLVSKAINYHVNVVGMHTVKDAAGNEVQEARQTEIPLMITGKISAPVVTPDVAVLGRMLLKKEVQEKIDQNFEKAKEKAGKIFEQLLN